MAGLDTSIALGIKPVDFGDPNEGRMNALRAQMMQMQMQQGQFNMMKAQRDMEYQNQQRAAAAAAAARDKAAEKEAVNAFLKTAQPGSPFNPNPNTPYAPADASAEGSGMFPAWNNAQPPDMNATIQQLINAGKFEAAKKIMGQNQAFNVNTESNLKVKKDTAAAAEAGSKAASAEIELFNKQYAPHRAALVNVTSPEEAAAWTSSMYDQPTFGDMMKKLGMSKEQAIAQSAQKFAENPQAWIVSQMNLDGEKAHKLVYGEGKDKKESDVATLIRERNSLNKNSPTYAQDLEIYNDRIEKATNIKGGGGNPIKLQQLQDLRDKLRADLETNPDDKDTRQALAEVTANINKEAKFSGAAQEEGRKGFEAALNDITEEYKKLGAQGMLLTPQSSIGNRAAAVLADALPAATAIVSPERAAPVAALKNLRENMKAAIIQASGGVLTSKNFDSNAEAKALLDSMSSPGQPLDTILATLNSMSRKYGNGRVLTAEDLTGGKEQNTSSGKSKPPLSTFNRPR